MRPDIVLMNEPPANPQPDDPPRYIPYDWFRGDAVGIPPDASNIDKYLRVSKEYGTTGYEDMVKYWCNFGFVVPDVKKLESPGKITYVDPTDDGETVLVESERNHCLDNSSGPCSPCHPGNSLLVKNKIKEFVDEKI